MFNLAELYYYVAWNAFPFVMLTVMEIQSVIAGHTKNVRFPSEDDWDQPLENGKEKIFLPAELFKKKGMEIIWTRL